jgi:hypothetical protein
MRPLLAVWSGPRNLSTALMRAFSSRPGTQVWDEPFYAHYLAKTGKQHPMQDAILASQPQDEQAVIADLQAPLPEGFTLGYQKQMAHHLLPHMDRDWMEEQHHAFLIRDPRAMLASLDQKLDKFELEDTGLPQQVELFERFLERDGRPPVVLDSADLARSPEQALGALCEVAGVPFEPQMLTWPAGPHARDGAWGSHWYANTWASTGFRAPKDEGPRPLDPALEPLLERCQPLYDHLAAHRVRVS